MQTFPTGQRPLDRRAFVVVLLLTLIASLLTVVTQALAATTAFDAVLAADTDGNGAANAVVLDGATWYVRGPDGGLERSFSFGSGTEIPVYGDWDGDGIDTPGLFADGVWAFSSAPDGSSRYGRASFGAAGDVPVVGDWDGDGRDSIGFVRRDVWYLSDDLSGASIAHRFRFGRQNDRFVVGDWDQDGSDEPAYVRGNQWNARFDLSGGMPDAYASFGAKTDIAVPGDWDGDGDATPGAVAAMTTWSTVNVLGESTPDNSFSWEPAPDPEPTQEPSPSPTDEPSPTPTEEPSPSPSPTDEPSPTPTEEPSPSLVNLLSADQHSFETSIDGWEHQGNTSLSRATSTAYDGSASLEVLVAQNGYVDSSRTARAGTPQFQNGIPVEAGKRYDGSLRIAPGGSKLSPVRCELRWYASDGSIISTVQGVDANEVSGEWVTVGCGATAPSTAAYVSLRVHVAEADYGDVHYVDDAWLTDGTTDETTTSDPSPTPTEDPSPSPTPTEEPGATTDVVHGHQISSSNTGVTGAHNAGLTSYTRETLPLYAGPDPIPAGSVIENVRFTWTPDVSAGNITFRYVLFDIDTVSNLDGTPNGPVTYEWVEFDGDDAPAQTGQWQGMAYIQCMGSDMDHGKSTYYRVDIHGCGLGLWADGPTDVVESYIHGLQSYGDPGADGSHNEAITRRGGTSQLNIVRSRMDSRGSNATADIFLQPWKADIANVSIQDNLMEWDFYSLVIENNYGTTSGVTVSGNLSNGSYGHSGYPGSGVTCSDNWRYDPNDPPDFEGEAMSCPW